MKLFLWPNFAHWGGKEKYISILGIVSFPATCKNFSTSAFSKINELREGINRMMEKIIQSDRKRML
jgi:hypothetical protein